MAVEMLVGLNVVDDEAYRSYRDEMAPILSEFGAEVLKSQTAAPINRVFTICFSNKDSMDSFFSNDEYLEIRQRHFEKSVTDTTIIATYER
jgi:uncharacterized protein (DUF1330 family)